MWGCFLKVQFLFVIGDDDKMLEFSMDMKKYTINRVIRRKK